MRVTPLSLAFAASILLAVTLPAHAAKEKISTTIESGGPVLAQANTDRRRPGKPPPKRFELPAVESSKVPPPARDIAARDDPGARSLAYR